MHLILQLSEITFFKLNEKTLDLKVTLKFTLFIRRGEDLNQFMTINKFSLKTGIPSSALRFYETKRLLIPERDAENGYRLYREEQVPTAKLIASLRKADLSIQDIQRYLQADRCEQKEIKRNWITILKERRQQLDLSLRYLEANQNKEEIFLFEKAAEKCIWFEAIAPPGEFKKEMLRRRDELNQQGLTVHNMYLKTILATVSMVKAEIGFGIEGDVNHHYFSEGKIKSEGTSLCVGLTFHGHFSNIVSVYRNLYAYCMENNWIPAGPVFEWYRGDQLSGMDLVMPILQIEGEKNEI